jgi:hypothetical protein
MPKLNFPELIKGDAIFFLMVIYRNHRKFMKELNTLRKPYIEVIRKFVQGTLTSFQEKPMSLADYYQSMMNYEGTNNISLFTDEQKKDIAELQPYFEGLVKLAEKWKLKTPWAAGALFIFDIVELMYSIPPEMPGIPLEIFEKLIPWTPPLHPLKIDVSAWTFFTLSRDEIISEIKDKLYDYEMRLKEIGIKEYPSRIAHHARWWFEHYVNGKTYEEIAAMEGRTPDGSLISYSKNIGVAVNEFSKLIMLDLKE